MQAAITELLKQLIAVPSVTPEDKDCQEILIDRLQALGFQIEKIPSGKVSNFWAKRGSGEPCFAFAGHTDVVPIGDRDQWHSDPFDMTLKEGLLYGRGTADMKGSLAAMIIACETFIAQYPEHRGAIGFIITSGEEGDDFNDGTPVVMQYLAAQKEHVKWCIIGEPTSQDQLGDTIKNGRRGSLTGKIKVQGKQGHVAYPHLAQNPIHLSLPALTELSQQKWDQGNDHFPATTLQISNIHSGTGAGNVIPGTLECLFNFRYSTETHHTELQQQVEAIFNKHQLNYHIDWLLNGEPFLTPGGDLIRATQNAIKKITGNDTQLSTSGGTSDGRFIAPHGVEAIELGPRNQTIHQINECIALADLEKLSQVYVEILQELLL
ncbi:MAG: succinyl-diaminopimelate desuccinylase [Gammaproteobacteria bacterium]